MKAGSYKLQLDWQVAAGLLQPANLSTRVGQDIAVYCERSMSRMQRSETLQMLMQCHQGAAAL